MKIVILKDYEEISVYAKNLVQEVITNKPDALICFPTGSTPLRLYELLVEANHRQEIDFSLVKVRSVDEYVGLAKNHHQSYAYFLHHYLLDKININPQNIDLLDGCADNLDEYCRNYQKEIEEAGGIDLYIDGVGANGHIGFNEPGSEMVLDFHVQEIAEETRIANSRFFDQLEEVPNLAITIGVNNILAARKSLFLSNGQHKAKAWETLMNRRVIDPMFPLSFLWLAEQAVAVLDQDSAKYLKQEG